MLGRSSAEALVAKVRERGRVAPVHVLVATGVDADGNREILGVQGHARHLRCARRTRVGDWRDHARRGLAALAHQYAAHLMSATSKSSWEGVKALLHSIYDQPDAQAVHAHFDRVVDALAEKLP